MSKISIALCTYNGSKFLPVQLESYTNQTRLPDELIVCDDNSTDGTARIINDFAQTAPFPVSFHINDENLGSTKNFERAIGLCTGDLIFLSDQDDVWLPHKIARIEKEFSSKKDAALIFSDAELVDEKLKPLQHNLFDFTFPEMSREQAKNGNFFEVLLRSNVVTGATMAFRSEYREMFMPIPDAADLIHDGWIVLVIAANAAVAFIEEPLIKYRQHSNQQIGIDLENLSGRIFGERAKRYAADIRFGEQAIARLRQMKEIFAAHSQFETRRETVSFEDLIRKHGEQIIHYKVRLNLPSSRLKRLLPVCREISSGRYRRFSKGFLSAAKDLTEKW